MPVSATIPVTEDFLQTVATFSFVTELIAHPTNGYIYGCYAPGPSSVGGVVKISATNYTDITITTFAADGKHTNPTDMVYVPQTDKFYVLFRIEGPSELMVSSVTPALVKADFISDDELDIGPGSLTSDGTNLYVVSFNNDPSIIFGYSLANATPGVVIELTGFTQAHCMRYFGTKLYVTGIKPPTEGWIARCTTAGVVEETATWVDAEGQFPVDDIGDSADHVWVGKRDLSGVIRKYLKTSFASVEEIATGQLSRCTSVKRVGDYVWAAFENGRGVRINPNSSDRRIYTLQQGQGYHSEFTGTNEFVHTYALFGSYAGKVSRYHIPSDAIAGNPIWVKGIGGTLIDVATAIAVDSTGHLIVVGTFQDTVDFTGNGTGTVGGPSPSILTSSGGADMFLAKYTSDGSLVWVKRFGAATGQESPLCIALDTSDNIAVGGKYSGTSNVGGNNLTTAASSDTNCFVAKYTSAGAHVWSRQIGAEDIDAANGICFDASGNVITTGQFASTSPTPFVTFRDVSCAGVDFPLPPGCLQSSFLSVDTFVAKYAAADGAFIWAKNFACPNRDVGSGVAVDPVTGKIVFAGFTQGDMNFGGGSRILASGYIARLNSDSSYDFDVQAGKENPARIWAMTLDNNGDIIIAGDFFLKTDFGGGTVTATAALNGFVAKYRRTDLALLWAKVITATTSSLGCFVSAIKVNAQNEIFLTGNFQGVYFFGTAQQLDLKLTSFDNAAPDIFVARYSSAGVPQWARNFGSTGAFGTGSDYGRGIAVDASGFPYVVGSFTNVSTFGDKSLTSNGNSDIFLIKLNP